MKMNNWTDQEETKLTEFLIARISEKASGRSEAECVRNYPRDIYFIGNLRPKQNELNESEMLTKLAPAAFGVEFVIQSETKDVDVSVTLRWACYYRIFPTFAQQLQHQHQNNTQSTPDRREVIEKNEKSFSDDIKDNESVFTQQNSDLEAMEQEHEDQISEKDSTEVSESPVDRSNTRNPHDSLFIRFRKLSCQAGGRITLRNNQNGHWLVDSTNLQVALEKEVARVQQIVLTDPMRIQTDGDRDSKVHVPELTLTSEAAYSSFLKSLHFDVKPEWQWEVRGEIRAIGEADSANYLFAIEFVNTSQMTENSPNTEAFLFDTKAIIEFAGQEVHPFELELSPRGFRYNRQVWGHGINCAVERQDGEHTAFIFSTTHTPVYHQMRFAPRTTPPARFTDLAKDPLPSLDNIYQEMERYRKVWEKQRQQYIEGNPNWEAKYSTEFERDSQIFDMEIERFKIGCELIRTNPDIRLAFRLTNETFRRGPRTEWRLFQIVFLVSQIPGIAALSDHKIIETPDRDIVDIIYFRTGAGKTEAYLGTIVFHCFFDRLRGKSTGVTAWTRFPLRLLTLQQTQRVADVIGIAELVRREQSDIRLSGKGIDGFAVGYFVGESGSPNEVTNPRSIRYPSPEMEVIWSKVNDNEARQDWKRVVRCPSCRTTTIHIEFDAYHSRLIHRCSQPSCCFPQGIIPVYIVDNEIYRYLPSVIVGTIDKLAGLGNQRKFALIFGQVKGQCSLHGYYNGHCCQKDCTDKKNLQRIVPPGISGPTLFVQDELHLLKEGLGTFDAHYETLTQQIEREFGQIQPLKIIASSATIEAFERQVSHLYGRSPSNARVFPGFGPTLEQSFYSETLPFPQRLYVGLIPHNKTIFNCILELIDLYHREIQDLQHLPNNVQNPFNGELKPGTKEWQQLLNFYATSITYFLANRELNSIRTDLEGDVIPNLERDGLILPEISELTGSTSTDDVSRILEKLERIEPLSTTPDIVLATNMVSHGVDVDRFNSMIFYGMPRQNAEYIQASSRVGRSHVGIVFTCLHPVRERDQSHYAYFVKFHEFLGQLVEPVAINRWSKFSINRTLPGLFMSVLLQLVSSRCKEDNPNRYYMLDFVKGKISDGSLQPEYFISFLEQVYGVKTPTTPGENVFRDEIHKRVHQYFDWILSPAAGLSFVSDVLIPKPMRSLRDVDEAIPIELDLIGSRWVAHHNDH